MRSTETDVVKIEITLKDGTVLCAEGTDAEKIWAYWKSGEALLAAHGARYAGPSLKEKTP